MAVQNLVERAIGRKPGFHHEEDLLGGITGDPVVIPPLGGVPVTATVVVTGVSGKIEFTTSTDAKVAAGTAVWQDWDPGTVTVTTSDALITGVTAVRGVSVSGTITIELVI